MKEIYKKSKKANKENDNKGSTTPSKSTNGTSKWRAPTAEKKNRRTIDEKAMFWNGKLRKWVSDRGARTTKAAATAAAPVPVVPPIAVQPAPTAPIPETPAPAQQQTAAIAAARQAYANAFAALQQLG